MERLGVGQRCYELDGGMAAHGSRGCQRAIMRCEGDVEGWSYIRLSCLWVMSVINR